MEQTIYNPKALCTAQKMTFSIKDFFSKCDQICSFLRIWSHLLKKSLMENSIFCAVLLLHNIATADTKIDFNFEGKGANNFDFS